MKISCGTENGLGTGSGGNWKYLKKGVGEWIWRIWDPDEFYRLGCANFRNKSGKRGIGRKASKSISFRIKQKKNINKYRMNEMIAMYKWFQALVIINTYTERWIRIWKTSKTIKEWSRIRNVNVYVFRDEKWFYKYVSLSTDTYRLVGMGKDEKGRDRRKNRRKERKEDRWERNRRKSIV